MQSNLSIPNSDGATFRGAVNAALQALASMQSGAAAPATTYAFQLWADTTTGILKQRNSANSAWLEIGAIDSPALGILSRIVQNCQFKLDNAAATKAEIGRIEPFMSTNTAGTETGGLRLHSKIAGVLTKLIELEAVARLFGASGELQYIDGGALEGPDWDLIRDSNTPAANDLLGAIRWKHRNSANAMTVGAKLLATLVDPTAASEDVSLSFLTIFNGALAARMTLAQGLVIGNPTGGDKGTGTINAEALYVNGASPGQLINTVLITASGTYTKNASARYVIVYVYGGGGGGGGAKGLASWTLGACGGGAGGVAIKKILVSALAASETVTIGAAGAAGATTPADGGAGGTSSFGAWCSASGGQGGKFSNGATTFGTATGAGGVGSGGDINLTGQAGAPIWVTNSSQLSMPQGASSVGKYGQGGPASNSGINSAAVTGNSGAANSATGGVGGSPQYNTAASVVAGGAGGSGFIVVEEYA